MIEPLSYAEWKAQKTEPLNYAEWKASQEDQPPEQSAPSRFLQGVGGEVLKAGSGLADMLPENKVHEWLSKESKAGLDQATGFAGGVGKFVGASLPYFALPGGGLVKTALMSGALSGATTEGDMTDRATAAALTGGLSGGVGVLAKSIKGFKPSEGAKKYMAEGIQPTVGQGIDKTGIFGKAVGKIEEAAKSVPFIGQAIEHARTRAKDEWAQNIVKKAEIPELGITAGGNSGYDAIGSLQKTYSNAYNDILTPEAIPKGKDFNKIINAIIRTEPGIQKGVMKELSVLDGKSMNAADMHSVAGALRDIGSRYSNSPSAAEHYQGEAYKDVADAVRSYMTNKLPIEKSDALKLIDTKYGLFKTMQKAALSVAAEDGKFSGSQLLNAVKVADKTKDKSSFAKGAARLQDEAVTAKKIFGDTMNESGTTPRAIVSGTLLGGAAYANPYTMAAIPLAWAGQTKPVQKALLGGYPKQEMIAELVRKLTQRTAGAINE